MQIKPGPALPYVIGSIGSALGLIGGFMNAIWLKGGGALPIYGVFFDGVLGIVVIALLFWWISYSRRHRGKMMDEFADTKKKYAVQSGFIVSVSLITVVNLALSLWPHLETEILTWAHRQDAPFAFGLQFSVLILAFGLGVGHLLAWLKYR